MISGLEKIKAVVFVIALLEFAFADSFEQEDVGGYLFFGTAPSAIDGESHFPILKVDGRRIHIDKGIEIGKVPLKSFVRTDTELILSERFADVLEIDFNTSSVENLKRISEAVAEMHRQAFQSATEVSRLSTNADPTSETVGLATHNSDVADEIDEIVQDNADFQHGMQEGLDSGAFESSQRADLIVVTGTLDPVTDIPGAYCVVVVNHDVINPYNMNVLGRASFARARYLGDMVAGKLVELSVKVSLSEFHKSTAEFEFHLFDEDGKQVALSNSRGLKALNAEEVATFKELELKTGSLDRS